MKKGTQILILVFLILVIIGAGYCFLMKMEILPVPAFLKSIPVFSSYLSPDTSVEESEKSPEEAINKSDKLQAELTEKNEEIKKLNTELKTLQKKLEESQNGQVALQQQVLQLQDEMEKGKVLSSNKEDTYKNLSEYYTVMKVQDAAAIMAQLNDEDIIGIFNEMESETVAAILQSMDRSRAAALSKKMLTPGTI